MRWEKIAERADGVWSCGDAAAFAVPAATDA